MAPPSALNLQSSHHATAFACNLMPSKSSSSSSSGRSQNLLSFPGTGRRRLAVTVALADMFLTREAISMNPQMAGSFDFLRMTVPDQSLEEAEAGIRGHAKQLLQIKALIDSASWRDAQKLLRERSPYVKQDLYTIIQGKPGSQRPLLRKLYSKLFNSVTRLDYAARSKDAATVKECYNTIVATLDDIFATI